MTQMEFFNAIKADSLRGAYVLHGEEEFVKDSALVALVLALPEVSRELNLTTLESGTADEVVAACETLPFFAERRMVVCRFLPTEGDGQKLAEYIKKLPETALLVFFVRGKAKETLSVVKAVKAAGGLVEFSALSPQDAAKWVTQKAAKLGVTTTPDAARYIVALVGVDIQALNNEFTKAASYAGFGSEVTKEHISACVTRNLEIRVFDMMEYFLAHKPADGMRAYRRMLSDGESPFRMAALLENRFKTMLAARTYIDKGLPKERVIQLTGGTYPAKKAYESALRYTRAEIVDSLRRFANVGYLKVSGQMDDAASFESALIRCMPKR